MTPIESEPSWESQYLRREEAGELQVFVEENAAHPWFCPMVVIVALTGARWSKLLRAEVTDVDLAAKTPLVREMKRSKKQRTTRHVSLTPGLKAVLTEWLASHPRQPLTVLHVGRRRPEQ